MKLSVIVLSIFVSIIMLSFDNQNKTTVDLKQEFLNQNNKKIIPPATPPLSKLKLLSQNWENDEYFSYIVGVVENTSNKKFNMVCISYKLLDKDDITIGTAGDCVDSLEAGEKWKFKAIVTEENVKKYKFKEFTGF